MNRPGPASECLVCGLNLTWLRRTALGTSAIVALDRQIDSGLCDDCQRARQSAAVEYMAACDAVRLLGGGARRRSPRGTYAPDVAAGRATQALTAAMHRIEGADARCVALKMWPATR